MTKKDKTQLIADVKAYAMLRSIIREAENDLKDIKTRLLEAADAAGGAIETPTHIVKVITSDRKTILADRLIERGVTPAVILFATKVTAVSYARVDAKKVEVG